MKKISTFGYTLTTLILLSFLMGCGQTTTIRVKGGTQSDVQTHSDIVLTIDVSGCKELPVEQRLECIKEMTNALKELSNVVGILSCAKATKDVSGVSGTTDFVVCWRSINDQDERPSTGG
jgi:hypothetical protein